MLRSNSATRRREPGMPNTTIESGNYNLSLVVESFKSAMQQNDIEPPDDIIADGELHRFGDTNKQNCWYVLHPDRRPGGVFGDWSLDTKIKWCYQGQLTPLSREEQEALAEKRRADAVRRAKEDAIKHAKAEKQAKIIWSKTKPAESDNPYLERKMINPYRAREYWRPVRGKTHAYHRELIIPMFITFGELVNLQYILADGNKRFITGGVTKGCFCPIGKPTQNQLVICEGYATGASIYELEHIPVLVAFSASNLENVAIYARARYPFKEIIIAADNDKNGIGKKKAVEAAGAITGPRQVRCPKELGDYNDAAICLKRWKEFIS